MVKKFLMLSFATLSVLPSAAFGGFQVVEEGAKPAQAAKQAPNSVSGPAGKGAETIQLVTLTYIGDANAEIQVRNGFGRDVRLADAIKQIAPSGWQVFIKDELLPLADKFRAVSWKGGRRWVEVLDILANEQNLAIDVDWTKKHLYVGEKKIPPAQTENQPATRWNIRSGEKISEALARWSKISKWQLIWEVPELVAQADIDLTGSFEDAVANIIEALNRNGNGLKAQFYASNHVLRIVERK